MPREAARIKAAIWSDRDFTALPLDAQWLYLMLLSQPSLNLAGVLTIPRRMWANLADDEDAADRIAHAWKVLEDRRYVVSDDETDELLVRSFIRNDVEYGAPGPFVAAMAAAAAVQSPRLRTVLLAELQRLDPERLAEKKPARHGERPYEVWQRTVADLGRNAMSDEPANGMNTSPRHAMPHAMKTDDVHAMTYGIGAGVGAGEESSVGNGVTSVGAADADAGQDEKPKKPTRSTENRGTLLPDDWWPDEELRSWVKTECPAVTNPSRETQNFVDYWLAKPGKDARKVSWRRTYQTWMRREQTRAEQRATHRNAAPSASTPDPAVTGRRRVQC